MQAGSFRANARTLEVLEWPHLQDLLEARARTPMGKRIAHGLVPGSLDAEAARNQALATLELLDMRAESQLQLPLNDVPEIEGVLQRISRQGQISLEEFANFVRFHKISQGLYHFVHRYASKRPRVVAALRGIELVEDWSREHFPLLDPQGGMVDSASEDLRALRALVRELHEKIKQRLDDYLHNPRLAEIMQDFYITIRDGRYVVPVKTNFKGRVPGIVHDVSNSEATIFVEPEEIVEWNNQLKVAEKEIEREIERILTQVVADTAPYVESFEKNYRIVAHGDFLSAAASLAGEWAGGICAVEWSAGGEGSKVEASLELEEIRHPILSLQRPVVANTLSWNRAFILTGPNTGGKTVLLKSAGLAVAMAWSGIPIPAKSARLPLDLRGVFADIGDEQSLEQNLSTFSGHLLVLKEVIASARQGDLVLIDEIATGTSPEEGQPLAQAVIERLLGEGVRVFVTTHYGGLKQFAMIDDRCRIASMAFDSVHGRPTYEVMLDIPGESSAFEIAEQLGLSSEVVNRARQLRGEVSPDLKEAIGRLEEARRRLLTKEEDLLRGEQKAREREEKAQEKILEYEKLQRQGLGEEARNILKNLNTLREELSQAVKRASSESAGTAANNVFVKLGEAADEVRGLMDGDVDLNTRPLSDEEIKAEAVVEVDGFGVGRIVETPRDLSRGARTPVQVQVGEIQMTVTRAKLRKPSPERLEKYKTGQAAVRAARERREKTGPTGAARSGGVSGSIVCDVRGRNVDEAMRKVEISLNELSRDENAIVTIIHGHGSDRLKDSIRGYIRKERDDLEFRPGTWPGEGGDGVTVVERAK